MVFHRAAPLKKGRFAIFVWQKWDEVGKKALNIRAILTEMAGNGIQVGENHALFLKTE